MIGPNNDGGDGNICLLFAYSYFDGGVVQLPALSRIAGDWALSTNILIRCHCPFRRVGALGTPARSGGVGVDHVPFPVIARAARIWAGVDGVRVDRLTPPPAAALPS